MLAEYKIQPVICNKTKRLLQRFVFILVMTLIGTGTVFGQQITVSGQVTGVEDETLIGVTILIKGTNSGTTTDIDGFYSIDVDEDDILVFSYVGYNKQEIPVNGRTEINVKLQMKSGMLDEVVVIGYGEESRRMLTTSIGSVGGDKIEGVPVSGVSNAIQGKVSGVRIRHSEGGQPGAPPSIRVRGGSSITGGNSPMFLVDGIERPNLRDINPGDIQSIEVLKDAASTAIYGSRASNGVILVTTKSGKRGQSQISFDYSLGASYPSRKMDLLNGEEFINLVRPAAARAALKAGLSDVDGARPFGTGNGPESPYSPRFLEDGETVPKGWKSMPDPLDPSKTIIFTDTDYQDEAFRRGIEQNYDLKVAGGTNKFRYYGGIGYSDFEGIALGSEWDRFSVRANVDYDVTDNLTFLTKVNGTLSNTNTFRDYNHIFGRSMWIAPTTRKYMPDGSYGYGRSSSYTTPRFYNDVNVHDTERRRTQFGSSLRWIVPSINGLSVKVSADYYFHENLHERFENANIYNASRDSRINQSRRERVKTDGVIDYVLPMGRDQSLKFIVGGSYEFEKRYDIETRGRGGATDLIKTLNAAPEMVTASSYKQEEALTGAFSRVSYDYKRKYILAATLRRDASSRFAPENRVGYFPGLSAAWIATEESFFPESFLSMLKLRSSWGQTGNVVSGYYTPYGEYTVGRNYYEQAGSFPVDMSNFSLTWETTTQIDVGVDLGLFDDRVEVVFDVYDKVTDDLLFSTPLPRVTGFSNIQQNVGSVRFYGWELELGTNIIQKSKFAWNLDFNVSYNMNEVLSLPDNGRNKNRIGGIYDPVTDTGIGGIAEGERLGALLGYESAYIIDNWDQANSANIDESAAGCNYETGECNPGQKFPGDMEWVDQNGDGVINQYDQIVLGYNIPHTWGGITNNFSYGNFSAIVHMDFTLGHTIMDATKRRGDANAIGGDATPTTDMLNSWKEIGDIEAGRADMPRFDFHDAAHQANIHRDHDRVAYKADFLSLREVMLAYSIPNRINDKLGFAGATVFVRGQNLYYFTDFPVFNPEAESGGNNYGGGDANYPLPRKILAGVSLKF